MLPWNDTNRYNQTGYSAPTIWPLSHNYKDTLLWNIDYALALEYELSHQDWIDEEDYEARIEARIQAEETKALREEYHGA